MVRCLLLGLLLAVSLFPQPASLTLLPAGQCMEGFGRVRIVWQAPGVTGVQILVGEEQRALTGLEPPAGSTETGDWVVDGMLFTLVASDGAVLASDEAFLDCEGSGARFQQSLAALGWFPLQVGNRWVYRLKTRQATAAYQHRAITGTRQQAGQRWYVLSNPETLLRADAEGRVYRLAGGREELFLDPSVPPSSTALLRVERRGSTAETMFGVFPGVLFYSLGQGQRLEHGEYVRGLGLLRYTASLLAGSSGGFLDGVELVEARIAGKLHLRMERPRIALSAEKTTLDVSGQRVTNCAVPCYFVACGLAPGADPPGTFKPCFESRLSVELAPAGAAAEIALLDSQGTLVHRAELPLPEPRDALLYHQAPLYSNPNAPFAPGRYLLRGRITDAGGAELAASTLAIEIR